LEVLAKDFFGNLQGIGGLTWKILLLGPTTPTVPMIDNNDGTYQGSFKLSIGGNYKINISTGNSSLSEQTFIIEDSYTNYCNKGAFGFLLAIVLLLLVVIIIAICIIAWNYNTLPVKANGLEYNLILLISGFCAGVSILLLIFTPSDGMCGFNPWLWGISFSIFYGIIFAKLVGRYIQYVNARDRRKQVEINDYKKYAIVCGLLAYEVLILIIWTAVPSERSTPKQYVSVTGFDVTLACYQSKIFVPLFYGVPALVVLAGVYLSLYTRTMITEGYDNNFTILAYLSLLIILPAILIILLVIDNEAIVRISLEFVLKWLAITICIATLVFPKIYYIFKPASILDSHPIQALPEAQTTKKEDKQFSKKDLDWDMDNLDIKKDNHDDETSKSKSNKQP